MSKAYCSAPYFWNHGIAEAHDPTRSTRWFGWPRNEEHGSAGVSVVADPGGASPGSDEGASARCPTPSVWSVSDEDLRAPLPTLTGRHPISGWREEHFMDNGPFPGHLSPEHSPIAGHAVANPDAPVTALGVPRPSATIPLRSASERLDGLGGHRRACVAGPRLRAACLGREGAADLT